MKIPEDVFKTRCPWCVFYQGRENVDIPDGRLFSIWADDHAPCRIIGIAQCCKVPGECLSFQPNPMFGICGYCSFSNDFAEDRGFCTHPSGPENKRTVYLAAPHGSTHYWDDHNCCTCDRYRVAERWKDIILEEVKRGRAPANFDPDTWEPLEDLEGSPAAVQWAKIMREEREAQEAAAALARRAEEDKKAGQISLFGGEEKE